MELNINIGYEEVVAMVRQLPKNDVSKLTAEIKNMIEPKVKEKTAFQNFLLTAPIMTDKQFEEFSKNRKQFNTWRTK